MSQIDQRLRLLPSENPLPGACRGNASEGLLPGNGGVTWGTWDSRFCGLGLKTS